jgi:branched-chain amino acid transport system ATP-binding protein
MSARLEVADLTMRFGGLTALDAVSLTIAPGQLVGLIGPNGSGKTTLLNIVGGYYRQTAGHVALDGHRIDKATPTRVARLGIGRSFQVTKLFRRLTLLENLLVPGLVPKSAKRRDVVEKAMGILERLNLTRLAHERASSLSGGQGKLLEFGRIMMLDPRIVLLDEPFGGVHPQLKQFMYDHIRAWNADGVTIVLISHDMGSIFGLCQRVVTLSYGEIIADGTPDEVRQNPAVLDAYLGEHRPGGHHAA